MPKKNNMIFVPPVAIQGALFCNLMYPFATNLFSSGFYRFSSGFYRKFSMIFLNMPLNIRG